MAVLPDEERIETWADLMRQMSDEREPMPWTKDVLRATVDAVDQWVSDNAVSFNSALPTAFRNTAGPALKAFILVLVVTRRHLKGV